MAVSGATFAAPGGNVPSGFLGALLAGFLRKVTECFENGEPTD